MFTSSASGRQRSSGWVQFEWVAVPWSSRVMSNPSAWSFRPGLGKIAMWRPTSPGQEWSSFERTWAIGERYGAPVMRGSLCLLDGEIPAAQVRALEQQLPGLTRGEGVLEATFGHYQPVRGEVPERPRTDHNPLNREEYLLRVARRVAAR